MAAPIKHTCPTIDKYIKSIKQAMYDKRSLQVMSEIYLLDAALEMSNELSNCIDYLEDLRDSNDALRKWGEELTNELESAATYINELENQTHE